MKTIILGAGFAGLGAGIAFRQANRNFQILEATSRPGGMAKTDYKNGFYFDRGGHFLHFASPTVEQFFCRQGIPLTKTERKAGIFIEGQIIPYPIQYNLWALSPQVRRDAFNEMKNCQAVPQKSAESAVELFSRTWGETLTKIFFRPYNEKLWGRRLEELPADCISRFMPLATPSLIEQGYELPILNVGYNSSFLYPNSGRIGDLSLSLAKSLNPHIKYNSPVMKINLKQKTCISQRGHSFAYDFLISTIPLPALLKFAGINFENTKIFEFTKLMNLQVGLKGIIPHSYHWLYIPEEKVNFHRIIFPKNVNKRTCPHKCSSISLEYTIPSEDSFPETSSLANIALDYLSSTNLINLDKCLLIDVKKISPAYIIFRSEKRREFTELNSFLRHHGILSAGRFGVWDYYSMEDSFLSGVKAAGKIILHNIAGIEYLAEKRKLENWHTGVLN